MHVYSEGITIDFYLNKARNHVTVKRFFKLCSSFMFVEKLPENGCCLCFQKKAMVAFG